MSKTENEVFLQNTFSTVQASIHKLNATLGIGIPKGILKRVMSNIITSVHKFQSQKGTLQVYTILNIDLFINAKIHNSKKFKHAEKMYPHPENKIKPTPQ